MQSPFAETRTLFANGNAQLMAVVATGDLIITVGGRDWFYPKTIAEGLEKMLKRDWDETLNALANFVEEAE